LTRSKAKSRSLVVHPHEDMRVNFLVMTAVRFGRRMTALGFATLDDDSALWCRKWLPGATDPAVA
jgi:hypothetical protein